MLVYGVNTPLSARCLLPRFVHMGDESVSTQNAAAGDSLVAADPAFRANSGSPPMARTQHGPGYPAGLSAVRVLPDPGICRAETLGLADYAQCLVESPLECRHALSFGYRFLCRHPQWNAIAMRTSAHDGQG
jgi:hypothetical protein